MRISRVLCWPSSHCSRMAMNVLCDRLLCIEEGGSNCRHCHCSTNVTSQTSQDSTTIPFVGDLTTQLTKKLKHKLRRSLVDPNVNIRIKQKTTKLCFFTCTKDKTPPLCKSDVAYEFTCPGCNCSYIGKTNRTLFTRTQEHALTDKESAISTNIFVLISFSRAY